MIFYDHDMSSSKKGESIYDTIKTVENFDAIIIEHPDNDIVKQCSEISRIPVLNAGNGSQVNIQLKHYLTYIQF